jgi:hypothetical protein
MAVGQLAVALPRVGRFAMQALPYIIGGGAAAKPLMEGRPLDALVSGGLGFMGGKGLKPLVGGLSSRAMAQGPRVAQAIGQPGLTGAITKGLGLAVPAAAVALTPQIVNAVAPGATSAVQKGVGTATQLGVGALGYQAPGPNQYGGAPYLPTDMYGGITPYGGPTDVMGPAGMGQRLDMYKTAETQRDINRLMNAENYALREASAKQDLARQLAQKGVAQNIATRASMQQRAQMAGIEAGRQALADAGAILRNQYQYQ